MIVSACNGRNLAVLIFLLLAGALTFVLSIEQLTFLVSDDAFYYLNVARNIAHGAGSSFDGINTTNGYHPLWMLLLIPIYLLYGNSVELALRLTLLLQSLLVAGTVWLAWDIYRRYAPKLVPVMIALAITGTLFSPLQIMFNGLETDLVILVIVLIVYMDARRQYLGTQVALGAAAGFGLLLGLLMLARLDAAFLVLGVAIWCLLRRQPQTLLARIASLCRTYWPTVLVFAVVVSPYFVWNWREFGHLTPISGTLKATFPHIVFRTTVLAAYAPYVAATLLAGLALIPMHRRPDERLQGPNLDLLTGLWIGCLMQLAWAVLFTSWGTFQWHFAAHIPVTCFILSFYTARLTPALARMPLVAALAAALTVAVVGLNAAAYYDKGDFHDGAYSAAAWARSHTPPGTVFALRDAGVFGYFSDRPTINLDGLINSYEYQHEVKAGRLMDFLQQRDVKFVADAFAPCAYTDRNVWVRSYLPPRPPADVAWGLAVSRTAEAYRSEATLFRPLSVRKPICFVVWPFETVRFRTREAQVAGAVQQMH